MCLINLILCQAQCRRLAASSSHLAPGGGVKETLGGPEGIDEFGLRRSGGGEEAIRL